MDLLFCPWSISVASAIPDGWLASNAASALRGAKVALLLSTARHGAVCQQAFFAKPGQRAAFPECRTCALPDPDSKPLFYLGDCLHLKGQTVVLLRPLALGGNPCVFNHAGAFVTPIFSTRHLIK